MASERKPYFFKVLIGNFACKLKLPPNFLKHLSNEASKQVSLVGPNGCSWSAELVTYADGTYISNGWSNFVEDHSLKEREFLVFRYDGCMNFSIQVFDTTACEREELFDIPPHEKVNMRNESTELITNVKVEVEDIEIDDSKSIHGNSVAFCRKSIERKLPVSVNTDASTSIREVPFSRGCPFSAKKFLQACEAVESFSSEFPTVIIQMTVSNLNKGRMRFPSWFSHEHLPRKITNITLTDPNENPWDVVYCPGINSQRDRFSKGWTDVVRSNNIKEGDFCIFEVISHTNVRMHVFPVYKETPNVNV